MMQTFVIEMHNHFGRNQQALELARRCLETSRRVLGDSHRQTEWLMLWFSYLYRRLDRFEEAEIVNRDYLARCEESYGLHNRETTTAMWHLGRLLRARGSFPAAEATFTRMTEIVDRMYGTERPRRGIREIVMLYQQWGRLSDAEKLQSEQVEVLRRIRGERHEETCDRSARLATIYMQLGRYDDSERLFRKLRQIVQDVEGLESRRYLTMCAGIGDCLVQRGQFEQAEILYRESLEGRRKLLGGLHEETRATIEALARLLVRAGREEDARPLWLELIESWRQVATSPSREKNVAWPPLDGSEQLGPAGERDHFAQILLSDVFPHLRDPEEALRFSLEANEISGFIVPRFLDTLARAYHATGQSEQAATTQRKAQELTPAEMVARREVYAKRQRDYQAASQTRTN